MAESKDAAGRPEEAFHIDQQVDLMEYVDALLRAKYRLLILAVIAAGVIFGLSKLVKDRYTAVAVVAINIAEDQQSVAAKRYKGNDTLGFLEHDFLIAAPNNELSRLLAKLGSYDFYTWFIERRNLLPLLFAENWDAESAQWISGFVPDMRVAVSILGTKIGFDHSETSGLLSISATTDSAVFSTEIVNNFYNDFNEFTKEAESSQLQARREYLGRRLKEVQTVEMQRSIYRLLETQLAIEALIFARENYPLEPIQPATVPLYKSYPSRKKWAIFGFIGVFFIGIFSVIGWVIFKKLRDGLLEYTERSKPVYNNSGSNDANTWVD